MRMHAYLLMASFHWSVPCPTDSTMRAREAASAMDASTPTITLLLLTMSPLWNDLHVISVNIRYQYIE